MSHTMTEVARRAGVSQATVSRVVNKNGYVSADVTALVKRVIEELGYAPAVRRKSKSALATDSNHAANLIVILMLDDSMDANPTLTLAKLRGVEAEASREQMSVAIAKLQVGQPLPPVLGRSDIAGVLLWGQTSDPRLKRSLSQLPTIWLSSHAEAEGHVVLIGNEQAGRIAAEYLLNRGVTRPALLFPAVSHVQYSQRSEGFRFGLHVAGVEGQVISGDADAVAMEKLTHQEQVKAIAELVEKMTLLDDLPDGLFVPDDQITALVYAELRKRLIEPERDIIIISCGNEPAYLLGLHPRPATIDLAPEATGRLAVEHLLRQWRNPEASDRASVVITPQLVVGDE